MRRALLVAALGLALGACSTTRPAPPTVAVPQAWQVQPAVPTSAPADAWWRDATDDPVLQALLVEAGATEDVAIARARLAEADARLRAARATLLPALRATAGVEWRSPDPGASSTVGTGGAMLEAPVDVSGALRTRTGAAGERRRAAAADLALARADSRRSAGQLYAALRVAQASYAAAERQSRAADESLELARARARAGLDSGLAVAQAQSAADAARARLPGFRQAETQARLGLEALLGQVPGAFAQRLAPASTPVLDVLRLLDAPAAVIARRADLRAAEARLAAAGLDASAARADRWPTATLSAAFTRNGDSRAPDVDLLSGGLTAVATLFDFGRLDALADAAGAQAEAEAAAYRRAVTFAVSEVELEADRVLRAREQAAASRAAATSARDEAELARARYASGLTSFLDVLLAERAVADAEIAQAAADGRVVDAGVALAAALGLGQEP
ncbi:MAG: TolC family protein [Steroidobacteraceae bacterium]|jgi:outer membrane protein TolC|nr:TolC family protein [Steroidobacteraceae bacterium]